jgi:hypothetical protein
MSLPGWLLLAAIVLVAFTTGISTLAAASAGACWAGADKQERETGRPTADSSGESHGESSW